MLIEVSLNIKCTECGSLRLIDISNNKTYCKRCGDLDNVSPFLSFLIRRGIIDCGNLQVSMDEFDRYKL